MSYIGKHTPRPWEIGYAETGVRWPIITAPGQPGFDDGSPIEICEISLSYAIDAAPEDPERVEAEANAHLIAAAPDYDHAAHLVAACAMPDMAGKVLISVEAFQAINAAIAKAKGR